MSLTMFTTAKSGVKDARNTNRATEHRHYHPQPEMTSGTLKRYAVGSTAERQKYELPRIFA